MRKFESLNIHVQAQIGWDDEIVTKENVVAFMERICQRVRDDVPASQGAISSEFIFINQMVTDPQIQVQLGLKKKKPKKRQRKRPSTNLRTLYKKDKGDQGELQGALGAEARKKK